MSPVTSGPLVNESLETNIPGIFACGNVLHVHDLVDYVSEEAALAGTCAARYVKENREAAPSAGEKNRIQIKTGGGVRYTVPTTVDPEQMDDLLKVRFRVGNVYKGAYVSVYLDDQRILHSKKKIMSPGEMEQVILQKKKLLAVPDLKTITICTEQE